ncbi:hypothetical protein D3C76_1297940 [compost metagenome]
MHPLRCSQTAKRARSSFHGVECFGELGFHAFTQGRQAHSLGVALEQSCAVFVFQGLDQGGDGPRGHLEFECGTGKAAQAG